jgi:hypothetical protein
MGACTCFTNFLALIASVLTVIGQTRPNVLLIMFDDLRPELSVYGRDVITPNFERLAAKSMVFDRAYNQGEPCVCSRADAKWLHERVCV